ncbi:hypothetical protein [Halostagnicola kamekurae]|uniref:Uncharacterized protein n=1 Tax=Halostagnicola kamekurae TaxID=619731 RepID=A0A1I6RF17_9EURY|nr:hypothetical protein [Halostagnicola kamekurae]SFS63292.1 hypothetical protein SAMN04488556_1748 [Halostagnicola kamekurae]
MSGYKFEFLLEGETKTISPDESIAPNLPISLSAADEWSVQTQYRADLSGFELADAKVYWVDDDDVEHLIYRGEVDITEGDPDGLMTVRGQDLTGLLKRGGAQVHYQSIAGYEAIRDYANTYLTDWEWDVLEPEPELVDEGLLLQDAPSAEDLSAVFPLEEQDFDPAAHPITLDQDVYFLQRTGIVSIDAGDSDGPTDPQYTGGSAQDTSDSPITHLMGFFAYDIPTEHIGFAVREGIFGPDTGDITYSAADGTFQEVTVRDNISESTSPRWVDLSSAMQDFWDGRSGDVGGNIEITQSGGTDPYVADAVVYFDKRFHDFDNFDNDVHEPGGHLDRPYEYPSPEKPVILVAVDVSTSTNITRAYVNGDVNDANGLLEMGVSFGEEPVQTEANTASAEFGSDTDTMTVNGQVALGIRTDLDPQDDTPRYGYDGQIFDGWELSVDTNDLRVIEDLELVGNHYENFGDLHDEVGMAFLPASIDFSSQNPEPTWPEDGLEGASFTPGQIQLESDWRRLAKTKKRDMRDYANVLKGFGEPDSEGERIEVEIRLSDEIAEHGEVPGPPVVSDATTLAELTVETRNELFNLASVDRTTGSLEVAPKVVWPGFAYHVEIFDEVLTLETSTLQDGSQAQTELEFEEGVSIESIFGSIRQNVRRSTR